MENEVKSSTPLSREHDYVDNEFSNLPTKQCYFLAGKHFVVIDQLIMNQLDLDESNSELFFQQYIDDRGYIILRPYRMKKSLPYLHGTQN